MEIDSCSNKMMRLWLNLLFWVLSSAILLFALQQILPILGWVLRVLAPFAIGLIVAYIFHPIVNFVQKKLHLGRAAGILVLVVMIALVLLGVMVWLLPVLYQQILASAADANHALKGKLDDLKLYLRTKQVDPAVLKEQGDRIQAVMGQSLTAAKNVGGALLGGVSAVGGFLVVAALAVVSAFYYLADMDAIPEVIRRLLPEAHRERVWELMLKANRDVGGFLRGQLIACGIVGLLTSALLFVIGMKQYAILVGSFAGLMHLVPYLGPIAGATPAILWVLMTEHLATWGQRGLYVLFVFGGFTLIELVDAFFSQPYIVGRQASLPPLVVMLALAFGAQAGLGGMIIAVPMACIVRVLWLELFWKKRAA